MRTLGSAALAALLACTAASVATAQDPFAQELAPEKQPAHVLNRLGYGPRPGDVAEVTRVGVEEWIRGN
jgi:hypothetical protein